MLYIEAFTEKRCLIAIFIVFISVSCVAKSFPHSFERATIPDEKVFYNWAKYYNDGKYIVPIEDWPYERAIELSVFFGGRNETLIVKGELKKSIEVTVNDADGDPVPNATVALKKEMLVNITDESGKCSFACLPEARAYEIEVKKTFGNNTAVVNTVVFGRALAGTYSWYLSISSRDGKVVARLFDTFNSSIENADVFLDDKSHRLGRTDAKGEVAFDTPVGPHRLVAERRSDSEPVGGAIVCVEGRYYMASEKAPGYSVFLCPFVLFGLGELASVVLMGLGTFSIYFLGKRLAGRFSATAGALLFATNSIAVQNVFTTGMSDLCSTVLATIGILFFVEHIKGKHWSYALAGGAILGCSVATRYSSVLIALAPFVFLVAMLLESKPYLPKLKPLAKQALPFLLGLILVGSAIAYYNQALFGSPFSAGYSQGQLKIEDGNSTIEERNYFGNFNLGTGISSWPNKMFFFLMLAPFAYLAPGGLLLGKRRPEIYLFMAWMCSVFFLYMNVAWVASWPDLARSIEDMRYFLPGIPAAAILASMNLKRLFDKKKAIAIALVVIFIVAGVSFGVFGITTQLHRQGMNLPPGMQADKVTIKQLLDAPSKYEDKLISMSNVTVTWTDGKISRINDTSSDRNINLVPFMMDRPPSLAVGDKLDVMGMFKRGKENPEGDKEGDWDLIAKTMAIISKGKSSYDVVPIEWLIMHPETYRNTTVRVENITVETVVNQHIFRASNLTVHTDVGVPPIVGTRISAQGMFVLNQFSEYELYVRQNSDDRIEMT